MIVFITVLLLSVAVAWLTGGGARGLAWGLFVYGALGVLHWMLSGELGPDGPQVLGFHRWLTLGTTVGAAMVWLLGVAVWRSNKRPGVGLCLVAVSGALLGGLRTVDSLNRLLDDGAAQPVVVTAVATHLTHARHSDFFMLEVATREGTHWRLQLWAGCAEAVVPGQELTLMVSPGAFGIPWSPAPDWAADGVSCAGQPRA